MEKPGINGEAWSQSRSPQRKLWGIRQEARRTGEMLSRAPEQGRTLQSSQVEVSDVIGSSGTLGGVRGQGTAAPWKSFPCWSLCQEREPGLLESSQEAKRRTSKQKCYKRCRRDGSVVNNTYCSSRGAQGRKEFSIQYL